MNDSAPEWIMSRHDENDPISQPTNPTMRQLRGIGPGASGPHPSASQVRWWHVNRLLRVDELHLANTRMLAYLVTLIGVLALLVAWRILPGMLSNIVGISGVVVTLAGVMGIMETHWQRHAPQRRV